MKLSSPLTIYIATSAGRNFHAYCLLLERLTDAGHRVLDWTKTPEFPLSPDTPYWERRSAVNRDAFGTVFAFCSQAATSADLVIYLGPAGQDAAGEVCMAYTAGVHTFGLRGFFEAPGTILNRAVREWFNEVPALLAAVERLAEEKAQVGTV